MLPTTIDGVIEELDRTIATARRDESRLGYFPALYRKVTASVQQGIADGRFEDGDRMERLDIIFANRYLEAIGKHRAGGGAVAIVGDRIRGRGEQQADRPAALASGHERPYQP